MHGHGIVGALWKAARRLVTARHCLRIAASFVLAAGIVTGAGAVPIEYDYTGGAFSNVSGVYTTADRVTGSFTFSDELPASSVITALPSGLTAFSLLNGSTTPLSQSLSFSLSDGRNTITNGAASNYAVVLSLDSAGHISNSRIDAQQTLGALSSAHIGQILDASNPGSNESFGLTSGPIGAAGQGYNFTAGTWSGPVTSSCASDVMSGVTMPVLGNLSNPSAVGPGLPTTINVSFMPAMGLHQTAVDCGVVGFDWIQTFKLPNPNQNLVCDSLACQHPIQLDASTIASNDPPKWGYAFCNPSVLNPSYNPTGLSPKPNCVGRFPYYYPSADAITFPQARCIENSPNGCLTFMATGDTSFNLFDSPNDPCLNNPDGTPGILWTKNEREKAACNNMTVTGAYAFTTQLVGILQGDNPPDSPNYVPLPFSFTWTDSFNGGEGGIIASSDIAVDPKTGQGGIIITSINGVSTVPEPATVILVPTACGILILARRRGSTRSRLN